MEQRNSRALSSCLEKLVVLAVGKYQMERFFPLETDLGQQTAYFIKDHGAGALKQMV